MKSNMNGKNPLINADEALVNLYDLEKQNQQVPVASGQPRPKRKPDVTPLPRPKPKRPKIARDVIVVVIKKADLPSEENMKTKMIAEGINSADNENKICEYYFGDYNKKPFAKYYPATQTLKVYDYALKSVVEAIPADILKDPNVKVQFCTTSVTRTKDKATGYYNFNIEEMEEFPYISYEAAKVTVENFKNQKEIDKHYEAMAAKLSDNVDIYHKDDKFVTQVKPKSKDTTNPLSNEAKRVNNKLVVNPDIVTADKSYYKTFCGHLFQSSMVAKATSKRAPYGNKRFKATGEKIEYTNKATKEIIGTILDKGIEIVVTDLAAIYKLQDIQFQQAQKITFNLNGHKNSAVYTAETGVLTINEKLDQETDEALHKLFSNVEYNLPKDAPKSPENFSGNLSETEMTSPTDSTGASGMEYDEEVVIQQTPVVPQQTGPCYELEGEAFLEDGTKIKIPKGTRFFGQVREITPTSAPEQSNNHRPTN